MALNRFDFLNNSQFGEHGDNTDEIIGYDDPLLHAAQYHMMPLTLG